MISKHISLTLGTVTIGLYLAGLLPGGSSQALAANQTWLGLSGTTANWGDSNNWSNSIPPGSTSSITSADVATFNGPILNTWGNAAGNPIVIDQPTQNIGGITFDTQAGNYFIGSTGGNSLLVSTGGTIQIASTFAQNGATETINAPLIIEPASTTTSATYTFANNSIFNSNSLVFGGAITGGTTTATNVSDTGGSVVLQLTGANSGSNTISGLISDGASQAVTPVVDRGVAINKLGNGTWYLTNNSNSFTGGIVISGGILNVSSMSNYGVASALGARLASQETSALGGIGLLINGGTLQYTGASNQSTNRQVRLGIGVANTIDSSGAGTVQFTYTGNGTNLFQTAGTRSLVLTGINSGNNIFSQNLADQGGNATTLSKTGTGSWTYAGVDSGADNLTVSAGTLTMSNSNTYTGATSIYADGSMILSGTLAGTTPITVSAGGLFTENSTGVIGGTASLINYGSMTLNGANTTAGSTTAAGGTLNLNFAGTGAPATNILSTSGTLVLAGGNLTLTGKASTTNSQKVAATTIGAGGSVITMTANATSNPLLLNLGAITHSTGGTVVFNLPTGTQNSTNGIVTSTAVSTGLLGTWGMVLDPGVAANTSTNGYTFATLSGTDIVPYTAAVNDTSWGGVFQSGTNYDITGAGTNSRGIGLAAYSVRVVATGASVLQFSTGSLTTNALMTAGVGGALTISAGGGGLIIGTNSELDLEAMAAPITVSSVISNNGSTASAVTIAGAGGNSVTLGGANTYTGPTYVDQGGSLSLSGSIGTTGAAITNAGIFSETSSGAIITGTSSFTNVSGTSTLAGINAYTGATSVSAGVLNLTGTMSATTTMAIGKSSGAGAALYQSGATSVLTQTSGAGGAFDIGAAPGASGYYNLSGGTVTIGGEIDPGGANGGYGTFGELDMSGGTINMPNSTSSYFLPDRGNAGEVSVTNISGGTVQIAGGGTPTNNSLDGLAVGLNNVGNLTSTITISGAGQFLTPSLTVKLNDTNFGGSSNATNVSVLNMNGGVLQTLGFGTAVNAGGGNGSAIINLNGGTIKAGNAANNTFLSGLGGVYVFGGGGTINNNAQIITIAQPFLAVTGSGVSAVAVSNGGSGYTVPPQVVFTGGGGTGATGYATINPTTGVVTGIVITSPGQGYTSAPTVTLIGQNTGSAAVLGSVTTALDTNGGLTFNGGGSTTLSGSSTYLGATAISTGTVSLTGALGGGFGGGTAITNSSIFSETSAGTISGTSSVTNSAGTTTLAGVNTYTGATADNGGTLSLTGTVGQGGGTAITNSATFNEASTGVITGASSVTNSAGTMTVAGANTYTGVTNVNGGTLKITGGTLANTSALNVAGGATLAFTGNTGNTIGGMVTIAGGTSTATQGNIDMTQDFAPTTVVNLPGGLTVGGSAAGLVSNLSFDLAASGSGSDLINLGSGAFTGNPGGALINIGTLALNSAIYTLIDYGSISGLTIGGNLNIGTHPTQLFTTFTLSLTSTTGAGALQLTVTGTPIPNLAYWTGIQGGSYQWGDYNSGNDSTNWAVNAAGTSDAGQLVGGNTDVVFAANNATSASLNTSLETNYAINSLTIRASGSDPTSITPVVIGGTGSLTINALASGSNSLGYAAGTGIVINGGAAGLTINTTGKVIVPSNQSWANNSGSAFTVASNVAGAAVTGTDILTLTGTGSGSNNLSGGIGDGTGGGELALVVSDSGSGLTTLSGSNTFSGGLTLNAGTLDINNAAALGSGTFTINAGSIDNTSGSAITLANNAENWNGSFIFAGSNNLNLGTGAVTLASNPTVTLTSGTLTVGGAISGAGQSLSVAGGGTLVLAGSNSYTGATTITGATLQLGNGGTTGSLSTSSTITDNGTLVFNRSNAVTQGTDFSPVAISGSGSLVQNGAGALTLTGSNSYTGNTFVNASSIISNQAGLATGTITPFGSGGTVTVNGGAQLHLGYLPSNAFGEYDLYNPITINSGSVYEDDAYQHLKGALTVNGPMSIGSTYSYDTDAVLNGFSKGIFVDGSVSGTGAITVQQSGYTSTNFYNGSVVYFTTTGSNSYSGTVTVVPFASENGSYLFLVGNNALANATINLTGNNGADRMGTSTFLFGTGTNGNPSSSAYTIGGLSGSGNFPLADTLVAQGSNATSGNGAAVTLTVGGNNFNTTYTGVMSGGGGIIKTGTGTLSLNGNNTFTGGTVVNSGTLALGVGGSAGALVGSLTVNSGATVELNAGDALGYGTGTSVTQLNVNGGLVDDGGNFNNGFLANWVLTGGTMTSTGGGAFNIDAANADSITSNASGATSVISGNVVIRGASSILPINVARGSSTIDLLISGSLLNSTAETGANGIIKNGQGTLALSGSDSYQGPTTVTAGKLVLTGSISATSTVAVGTTSTTTGAAMYQTGATSLLTNTSGAGGAFQIGSAAGALGYYNLSSGTMNIGGEIDPGGSGGGAGTFGEFDMSGGTLNLPNNVGSYFLPNRGAAGETSVVNITGGTVRIAGGGTPADSNINGLSVNWSNSGAADIATITISGGGQFLTPSLRVKLNQGGSFNGIAGNSANVASLNLDSGGVLQTLGFENGVGNNANVNININGGTLEAGNAGNSNFLANLGGLYIYGGGATINNNGQAITIAQPLLAASGSGVSTVAVNNAGSGYVVPPVVGFSGNGSGATGYATIDPLTGAVTGIVITNPGTGYTSAPTVTLTGSTNGTVASAGSVNLAADTSGVVTFTGAGATALTGSSTYTGGTIINSGTVQINSAASLGASSGLATVNSGATLEALNAVQTARSFALNGNATIQTDSGIYEIDGAVNDGTSSGTLIKTGSGILDLTANNGYTGGTVINGGNMQYSNDDNLGAPGGVVAVNNGGTIEALNAIQTSRAFTLSGNAGIQADAGTYEIDSAITDGLSSGTLVKTGTGTLDLTGNNTYSGGTVINAGALQFSNDANLGNAGSVTINDGAKLTLLSGTTVSSSRTVNLSGTATIQVDQGSTYALSGQIGDGAVPGSLVKSGSGTLSVDSIGNSGTITVNRGALLIDGQASGQSGPLTVNSGGTVGGSGQIQGSVNIAQGGTIAPGYGVPFTFGTTLAIDDNLTLSGTADISINMDNVGDSDLLTVGTLTIDPTDTLTLTVLGTITGTQTYDIANFVTESGSFGNIVVNNGTLQSINYQDNSDTSITVTLEAAGVPEPGTWGLMVGGIGMLVWWQKKGRMNF